MKREYMQLWGARQWQVMKPPAIAASANGEHDKILERNQEQTNQDTGRNCSGERAATAMQVYTLVPTTGKKRMHILKRQANCRYSAAEHEASAKQLRTAAQGFLQAGIKIAVRHGLPSSP